MWGRKNVSDGRVRHNQNISGCRKIRGEAIKENRIRECADENMKQWGSSQEENWDRTTISSMKARDEPKPKKGYRQ